ncbi:MAG: carbohydrate-binding domain-containing protein, partial [Candidatus Ancillula sp.]|nr:carbohydrate-binding domain-containing protein [Candidatus Ancillula sp.]
MSIAGDDELMNSSADRDVRRSGELAEKTVRKTVQAVNNLRKTMYILLNLAQAQIKRSVNNSGFSTSIKKCGKIGAVNLAHARTRLCTSTSASSTKSTSTNNNKNSSAQNMQNMRNFRNFHAKITPLIAVFALVAFSIFTFIKLPAFAEDTAQDLNKAEVLCKHSANHGQGARDLSKTDVSRGGSAGSAKQDVQDLNKTKVLCEHSASSGQDAQDNGAAAHLNDQNGVQTHSAEQDLESNSHITHLNTQISAQVPSRVLSTITPLSSPDTNIELSDEAETKTSGTGWTYDSTTSVYTINSGADVTISGTTTNKRVVVTGAESPNANTIVNLDNVSITSETESPLTLTTENVDINLKNNNTLKATADNKAGLNVKGNASLTVEVPSSNRDIGYDNSITVYGGQDASALGANSASEKVGVISIESGTVIAVPHDPHGVAIGGLGNAHDSTTMISSVDGYTTVIAAGIISGSTLSGSNSTHISSPPHIFGNPTILARAFSAVDVNIPNANSGTLIGDADVDINATTKTITLNVNFIIPENSRFAIPLGWKVVVPNGKTLSIDTSGKLNIYGSLGIQDNGKLEFSGNLSVETTGTLDISNNANAIHDVYGSFSNHGTLVGKLNGSDIGTTSYKSLTPTSIVLNPAVLIYQTGQEIEYAISTENVVPTDNKWQTETTFSGLDTEKNIYYIFSRSKANNTYKSGIVKTSTISGVRGSSTINLNDESIIDGVGWQLRDCYSAYELGNLDCYYIDNGANVVITGSTTKKHIKMMTVDSVVTITLVDAQIISEENIPPIAVLGTATLNLKGTNTLKTIDSRSPAIYVPTGSKLTITSADGDNNKNGILNASVETKLEEMGDAAAIGTGGGSQERLGSITINGGTIFAKGADFSSVGSEVEQAGGAGIGGGAYSPGGDITINGGDVTAIGATGAAGIGGGYSGASGNITINGGVVNAIGGDNASAIGGGDPYELYVDSKSYNLEHYTINISGGAVTAKLLPHTCGDISSPAIGSSKFAPVGNINITGGSITALAPESCLAMGAGSGKNLDQTSTFNISGGTIIATGSGINTDTLTSTTITNHPIILTTTIKGGSNDPENGILVGSDKFSVDASNTTILVDLKSDLKIPSGGTFTISAVEKVSIPSGKTLTVADGGIVDVFGKLYIADGGTLHVDNTGRVIVEPGGEVENDGTQKGKLDGSKV